MDVSYTFMNVALCSFVSFKFPSLFRRLTTHKTKFVGPTRLVLGIGPPTSILSVSYL
ncbi:hypothetical protein BDR03DRAFT_959411 [Suillus americanus]|nr:hypothetical protein BDR03DRAFT_959411 [Suillus americanus]